jgi:hypothetical protein
LRIVGGALVVPHGDEGEIEVGTTIEHLSESSRPSDVIWLNPIVRPKPAPTSSPRFGSMDRRANNDIARNGSSPGSTARTPSVLAAKSLGNAIIRP